MKIRDNNSRRAYVSFERFNRPGILDHGSIIKKLNKALKSGYNTIILDLDGIGFIDSGDFRVILQFERILRINHKKLLLVNVSSKVEELIRLLHIDHVLNYANAA